MKVVGAVYEIETGRVLAAGDEVIRRVGQARSPRRPTMSGGERSDSLAD